MSTPLHLELKALAKGNPAAYLSVDFVNALTLTATLKSLTQMAGKEIPVGKLILSASLSHADFSVPPLGAARLVKLPGSLPNQIGLQLNSNLVIDVDVYLTGDKTKAISSVAVTITGMVIRGSYANNVLTFEGLDFKSSPNIQRTPNADALLASAGVDGPLEGARIEGVVAYSAVNNAISNALAQRKQILLSEVFPAFDFGTSADLLPVQQGESLAIIPAQFTRVESAACKCAEAGNISISASSNTLVIPSDVKAGDKLAGTVSIGGPIKENIDPLTAWGYRYQGDGHAGLYLPKETQRGLTVSVLPAIQVNASDDGIIGFEATGSVGFDHLTPSLDKAAGGVLVDVDMNISVSAICNLNIGCGIRLPIGYAIINQAPGSKAHLQLGFYPALDTQGNLKLRGTLKNIDMGNYVAVVLGVGTALEIIGVTAWLGFLIDTVLSAVISWRLPSLLRDEVRKYLGQNEWQLLKLGDLLKTAYPKVPRFTSRFDVDGDTLLASIGQDG